MGPHEVTGGKKIPLTEKPPKKMENSTPGTSDAQKYVPGQVLVKLKQGMDASALETLNRDLGLEIIKSLNLPGTYLMKINSDESVDSVVKKLEAYDIVEYSEPDYKLKPE
jgi:hypothetical protein